MDTRWRLRRLSVALACSTTLLVACGGGSSDSAAPAAAAPVAAPAPATEQPAAPAPAAGEEPPASPTVQATISGPARAVAGTRYTYAARVAGGEASGWEWSWSDGSPNTAGNPAAKVWSQAGDFTSSVTAAVDGAAARGTQSVSVVGEPISAGQNYTCALTPGFGAACWGFRGDGTTVDRSGRVAAGLTGLKALSVGGETICFLRLDGTAGCWGNNSYGQLGDGTTADRIADEIVPASEVPGTVVGLSDAASLGTSGAHTCAVRTSGTVVCWGLNSDGQLGDGTNASRSVPTAVTGLTGVTAVAAGSQHTCALKADGTAACWGNNSSGQLGNGGTGAAADENTPAAVAELTGAVALTAGRQHTCALKTDGRVVCWGANALGQLGDGTTADSTSPSAVSGLSDAVALNAGANHTCALKADGSVVCWGDNTFGQIGDGTSRTLEATNNRSSPVPVLGLAGALAISAGSDHTCALKTDGTADCWGSNRNAQLGNSTGMDSNTPVPASPGVTFWK